MKRNGNGNMNGKTVKDSQIEVTHIVRPSDLNAADRLFGGTLLSWIDEAAYLVARRHSNKNVTTVSINNLKFLQGAFLKDVIVLKGKVTYVGNTSMEVKMETFVEHLDGTRNLVNVAYINFVALDENGRPSKIPGLILETDEEKEEWEKAKVRRDFCKNNC